GPVVDQHPYGVESGLRCGQPALCPVDALRLRAVGARRAGRGGRGRWGERHPDPDSHPHPAHDSRAGGDGDVRLHHRVERVFLRLGPSEGAGAPHDPGQPGALPRRGRFRPLGAPGGRKCPGDLACPRGLRLRSAGADRGADGREPEAVGPGVDLTRVPGTPGDGRTGVCIQTPGTERGGLMRTARYLAVALALLLVVSAATPLVSAQEPVRLRFVSLAWQEDAIAAVKALVAEWNRTHPNIQVEYQQVDWGSIHDYLVTSFQTGDVPDVFHYESPQMLDFGRMGYLTDLAPLISDDLRNDVLPNFWETVSIDGAIYGVPYIVEPFIVLYNKDLFEQEGIEVDPSEPMTWDELRAIAKRLTKDLDGDGRIDQYGAGLPLRSPANLILNLSMAFDGQFFYQENGRWVLRVGEDELALRKLLHDMIYVDGSMSTEGVGLRSSELMAGFLQGRYAMIPGVGAFTRHDLAALA